MWPPKEKKIRTFPSSFQVYDHEIVQLVTKFVVLRTLFLFKNKDHRRHNPNAQPSSRVNDLRDSGSTPGLNYFSIRVGTRLRAIISHNKKQDHPKTLPYHRCAWTVLGPLYISSSKQQNVPHGNGRFYQMSPSGPRASLRTSATLRKQLLLQPRQGTCFRMARIREPVETGIWGGL